MTDHNEPETETETEIEIEEYLQECYQKERMLVLDEAGGPITTIPIHDEEDQDQ